MKNPQMILKKAWQAVLAVAVVALIAAGSVFAATEFLSGGDCKAFHTDGILFTGSVSITGTTVEKWRDRVLVTITDPNGGGFPPCVYCLFYDKVSKIGEVLDV